MNLEIIETTSFLKSLKKLAKKYKKLADDLIILHQNIQSNPTTAIDLGDNFYKIRLQNTSIPKGKSAGFRVVYFFKTIKGEIYLLDIYSKNELPSIHKDKLIELVKIYNLDK